MFVQEMPKASASGSLKTNHLFKQLKAFKLNFDWFAPNFALKGF